LAQYLEERKPFMTLIKSISGIRGTIGGKAGENLTPIDVVKFTTAFFNSIKENTTEHKPTMILGRDARVSGEILSKLVAATLQSLGANVIDIGLTTTPTIEMAITKQEADGGIILTASHNPMHWNALKLLNSRGEFISGKDAENLLQAVEEQNFSYAEARELGSYTQYENAIAEHIDAIMQLELVDAEAIQKANFSVVIDCVNSTGSISIPQLLQQLGVAKIKLLNEEPTGIFAHNPEPLADHLYEISAELKKGGHHVGFVVDPDVDRLAIIMEDGEMFGEEYTLVAVSDYILQHTKGSTVSNLSSTRALNDLCRQHDVDCYKSAVGEVNVVEMMKEKNAVIGGEGNGGVIYPELHYGRDALVGIALFLSYLAKSGKDCSEIKRGYSSYHISKNKIELTPEMNVKNILQQIAEQYKQYDVSTIDGVKVDFENSWVHLRPSNTEPIIRIYAEAATESMADNIANKIKLDIREIIHNSN
jgi:phosphoglucosamine mutase